MFHRILVPLDGSRFAEAALPWAAYLARRANAPLELVSVVDDSTPLMDLGAATAAAEWGAGTRMTLPAEDAEAMEEVRRERADERRRYLRRLQERIATGEAAGLEVHGEVRTGVPDHAVVERVEESGADLVVLSTHGRGPIERAWLGSVADRLARSLTVPVLLVRPPDDGGDADAAAGPAPAIRRILVPLDGSELAEAALDAVRELARVTGAAIELLRVSEPALALGTPYMPDPPSETTEIVEARRRTAQDYLDTVAGRLGDTAAPVERTRVLDGFSAPGIVDAARDDGADLIAMATHGRGGFRRWLLGSVSDKVVRSSHIPVLLVRPKERAR